MIEIDKKFKSFEDSGQTIVCGDCVDVLKTIPDGSIDVVVTSPPYNINVSYNSYQDKKQTEDYLAWCNAWIGEIQRVLQEDGSFFLNVAGASENPFVPYKVLELALERGFVLQNSITWVKSIHIPEAVHIEKLSDILKKTKALKKKKYSEMETLIPDLCKSLESTLESSGHSFGHFKPINSSRYMNRTNEPIFHLTKTGAVKIDKLAIGVEYVHPSNLDRWKSQEAKSDEDKSKRCGGTCWYMPYDTRMKESEHPATFPLDLPSRCIKLHFGERKDGIVMDIFSGSGTTSLAAKAFGCKSIGIEMD